MFGILLRKTLSLAMANRAFVAIENSIEI